MSPVAVIDTFSEFVDRFLLHMANQRRVAPNTVAAYQNDLRQFATYLDELGPQREQISSELPDLTALDGAVLAGFVLRLRDKGYAQATLARKIAAIKSFFRYAIEAGLIVENPAASLDSPRVQRAIPKPASLEDVQALLDSGCVGETPDSLRNRAMLTLLYYSGMRVSEVVALEVTDLDLDAGVVHCPGGRGRPRSIPLPEIARTALQLYLENGRPYLARDVAQEQRALFLNHRGTRLTRQGFWLIMKGRARVAGIQSAITPHTLRHSFAYERLGDGTELRELQELLGHMNISTTQIYKAEPKAATSSRSDSSGSSPA